MRNPFRFGPTPSRHVRTAVAAGALAAAAAGVLIPAVAAQASSAGPDGHFRPRAQIPFDRVGPGWTVATWSPIKNQLKQNTAKVSLVLVGAKGDSYLVSKLSAGSEPLAFSPAAQQVLVTSSRGQLADVDLRTGHSHPITIPNLQSVIGYTTPKGISLLVSVGIERKDGVELRLERYGAGGRHELTYPSKDRTVGYLNTFEVQQTPDRRFAITGGQHGLAVVRNSDGSVARRLLTGVKNCHAASMWSKDVVLAECGGVLYTVPIDGAEPHRVSLAAKQDPFGYSDAWQTGSSSPRLGLAWNGCGPASLVRFDRNGHGIRFTVPTPFKASGSVVYVSHHADTVSMIFNVNGGCQAGTRTLFNYDAAHNHSTALLGPGVNGGSVVGAVPFPTDR